MAIFYPFIWEQVGDQYHISSNIGQQLAPGARRHQERECGNSLETVLTMTIASRLCKAIDFEGEAF